ncbi:MAG: virulence protein [Lachnospiraceae bacterium]|nr:virulence protein [Lachnospiraceae bacterium]
MRIEFNRTGKDRKELVTKIAEITGIKSNYRGAPTMAYDIGEFVVTKNGAVESDDTDALEALVESLAFAGIISANTAEEEAPDTEAALEETTAEPTGDGMELTIEMPREKFTDEAIENLKRITESKGVLFKKAFETDELPINVTDEKVAFPWFRNADAEAVKAYTHFIEEICSMAINQKHVSAKEKDFENEKYAFRCFLLRLGFIGAEYKEERKILLKNLTGSSAFKSGAKGGAIA